jgi:hypothetical protein
MITIKPIGSHFEDKIEDAVEQVVRYIRNGKYTKEQVGIGHYEFWGSSGHDTSFAMTYDDEELFLVEIYEYIVPNYHTTESYLGLISEVYSKVIYTEYDEELRLNIKFRHNKVFIQVV